MKTTIKHEVGLRRSTLKGIGAAAGIAAWHKPLIEVIALPAHAITTDDTGSAAPGVTTTTSRPSGPTPPGTTRQPPGEEPPTTQPPPPVSGTGGVSVCHANMKPATCDQPRPLVCGQNLYIGAINTNNSVRVALTGFPAFAGLTVLTTMGNANCVTCNGTSATTDGNGDLVLFFQTGTSGPQTISIALGECTMMVGWSASNPGNS